MQIDERTDFVAFMQALAGSLPRSSLTDSVSVAGPGFVNIKLSDRWIEKVSG